MRATSKIRKQKPKLASGFSTGWPDLAAQILNAPLEFRLGEGVFRVAVDLCNKAM